MFTSLMELDAHLSRRLRVAERPGLLRRAAALLAHSGDSWFWLFGLGVIWFFGGDFARSRVYILGLAIFITAFLVMAVKFIVRRKRPEGEWGAIYRVTDPHSFPSGHAARAILLAVMLLGLGPAWIGVILAVWAPLVALARVAMGVHYLSDVMAGAVFGLISGAVLLPVLSRFFL